MAKICIFAFLAGLTESSFQFTDLIRLIISNVPDIYLKNLFIKRHSASSATKSVFKNPWSFVRIMNFLQTFINNLSLSISDLLNTDSIDKLVCRSCVRFLALKAKDFEKANEFAVKLIPAYCSRGTKNREAAWWRFINNCGESCITNDVPLAAALSSNVAILDLQTSSSVTVDAFLSATCPNFDPNEEADQSAKSALIKMSSHYFKSLKSNQHQKNQPWRKQTKSTPTKIGAGGGKGREKGGRNKHQNDQSKSYFTPNFKKTQSPNSSNDSNSSSTPKSSSNATQAFHECKQMLEAVGFKWNNENKFCATFNAPSFKCSYGSMGCKFLHICAFCQEGEHSLASCTKYKEFITATKTTSN